MPTIDELTLIHGNFSAINAGLKSSGYTQLTTANKCYWSSTVNPNNSNYYYRERVYDGAIFRNAGNDENASSTANYTRAVKSLLLQGATEDTPSYMGLYPYDATSFFDGSYVTMTVKSTQTATPGTFAPGSFPALGKTEGSYIHFYNICGGVRFSVTKSGIRRAVLKGNNGEKIAGKVKVGFSDSGLPEVKEVVDGVDCIVLEAPEGESFEVGKNYFFVIIPTVFENGFRITFTIQEETGTYTRSDEVLVKRSVFSGLKDVDKAVEYMRTEVVFEDAAIKRLCLINFDGNHDGVITYEELANVSTIGRVFRGTSGTAFPEFQYFTGVSSLESEAFFNSKIEKIILPESIETIKQAAFKQSRIREIIIPNGVILSGGEIFRECKQLTKVCFLGPSTQSIPFNSFYGCESLKSVSGRVSSIHYSAFENCTSLTEFNFDDVQLIDDSAFSNTALVYVDLSRSHITTLGPAAFSNSKLQEIKLPSTLQEIRHTAFMGNEQLTKLIIPASVNKIRGRVFAGSGITELYLRGSAPSVDNGVTGCMWYNMWLHSEASYKKEDFENLIIYVPSGKYDEYKNNNQWSSAPLVGYSF